MAVQLSPISILTEDWYGGFVPRDEQTTYDVDFEIEDDERDEYALLTQDRATLEASTLAWLHRDEDDSTILMRWNQPDDVLDELEQIEANDERAVWVERMTAFRETQLRRLLRDYFQSDRYMDREIVLKWEQKDGKWKPAEKMIVREWVRKLVEEKGSQLSGYASAAGFLRSRITRKRISQDKTGQSGSFARTYNAV